MADACWVSLITVLEKYGYWIRLSRLGLVELGNIEKGGGGGEEREAVELWLWRDVDSGLKGKGKL